MAKPTHADLLFACGGRIKRLTGRDHIGQAGIFQQFIDSSDSGADGDGELRQPTNRWVSFPAGRFRYEALDLTGDGKANDELALLTELQEAAENTYSADLNPSATDWVNQGANTYSARESIFPGQTAQQFTNVGGATFRGLYNNAGTFVSGADDILQLTFEEGSGERVHIGIWDATTSLWVGRAYWDISGDNQLTGIPVPGTGSVYDFGADFLGYGPNERRMWRVWVTVQAGSGVTGNSRRCYLFPTGDQINTNTATIHHAELNGGFQFPGSPIITTNGTAQRNGYIYNFQTNAIRYRGEQYTLFVDHISMSDQASQGFSSDYLEIGDTTPTIQIDAHTTNRNARMFFGDGTDTVQVNDDGAGDDVEVNDRARYIGTFDDTTRTLGYQQKIRDGAILRNSVTYDATSWPSGGNGFFGNPPTRYQIGGSQKLIVAAVFRGVFDMADVIDFFEKM